MVDTSIDKDNDTLICCSKPIINVSPYILINLLISLIVLMFLFAYLARFPDNAVCFSILSSIIAYWLPSPYQQEAASKNSNRANVRLADMNSMMVSRLQPAVASTVTAQMPSEQENVV